MNEMDEARKQLRALYGENKRITDGHYDPSLAVKCINGIFVGRREENVISYKGIPFVGEQPVGKYRWKAPVYCRPDDGVYEAYYNAKSSCQNEAYRQKASLYFQGEDCLYLNIWKAEGDPQAKSLSWCGFTAEPSKTAGRLTRCTSAAIS